MILLQVVGSGKKMVKSPQIRYGVIVGKWIIMSINWRFKLKLQIESWNASTLFIYFILEGNYFYDMWIEDRTRWVFEDQNSNIILIFCNFMILNIFDAKYLPYYLLSSLQQCNYYYYLVLVCWQISHKSCVWKMFSLFPGYFFLKSVEILYVFSYWEHTCVYPSIYNFIKSFLWN